MASRGPGFCPNRRWRHHTLDAECGFLRKPPILRAKRRWHDATKSSQARREGYHQNGKNRRALLPGTPVSSAPSRAECLQYATMEWTCEVGSAGPRWALGWRPLQLRLDISDATHIRQTMLLPRGHAVSSASLRHRTQSRLLIKQTSAEASSAGLCVRPIRIPGRPEIACGDHLKTKVWACRGRKPAQSAGHTACTARNPRCAPTHQLEGGRALGASTVGWNGGLRHTWRRWSEPARLASLALDMAGVIDEARHEATAQGFGKEQRQGRPALLYVVSHWCIRASPD